MTETNQKIICNGVRPTKADIYLSAAELVDSGILGGFKSQILAAMAQYDYYCGYGYGCGYNYYGYDDYYDYGYYYYYALLSKEERVIALLFLAAIYSEES